MPREVIDYKALAERLKAECKRIGDERVEKWAKLDCEDMVEQAKADAVTGYSMLCEALDAIAAAPHPAPQPQPVRRSPQQLCDALPEGVMWGDPLTPDVLSAAVDALSAEAPEGWQLVPKEPTKEMLDVFHDRIRILCKPDRHEAEVLNDREVWALMLAAAPYPAPQPQPEPVSEPTEAQIEAAEETARRNEHETLYDLARDMLRAALAAKEQPK